MDLIVWRGQSLAGQPTSEDGEEEGQGAAGRHSGGGGPPAARAPLVG